MLYYEVYTPAYVRLGLAARNLRVLESERDRSLDKQQRELIGKMTTPLSNLCKEMEPKLKRID